MSSKTQACDVAVQTIEIDLSEKGLTDLAAILVKSGRMSAPSFREWAHRTQQIAGRWAQETKKGTKVSGSASGKTQTKKSNSTQKVELDNKKSAGQLAKDSIKFEALLKVVPTCKLGNWNEVIHLKPSKAALLQGDITARFVLMKDKQASDGTSIRDQLISDFSLTEDETKASRAFAPYLPTFQKATSRSLLVGAGSDTAVGSSAQDSITVVEPPKGDHGSSLGTTTAPQSQAPMTYKSILSKSNYGSKHKSTTPVTSNTSKFELKDLLGPGSDVTDISELTEHFRKYDWSSIPNPLPNNFNKKLMKGPDVLNVSRNRWKKFSAVEKIEQFDKLYTSK